MSERPDGFLLRLLGGHYRLAPTFWGFGLVVGVVQSFLVVPVVRADPWDWFSFTTVAISLVFHVLVWTAIWKAANRHEGHPVSAALAKVAVVLWVLGACAVGAVVWLYAGWNV